MQNMTIIITNLLSKIREYISDLNYIHVLGIFFIIIFFIKVASHLTIKKREIKKVRNNRSLMNLSWLEFERFVAQYFREFGYAVSEFGGPQADGGIDLVIKKGRAKKIVQVKYYSKNNKISVKLVREMLGVYSSESSRMGLTGVVIVTSSSFTKPAIEFGTKNNVELVSGTDIINKLGI